MLKEDVVMSEYASKRLELRRPPLALSAIQVTCGLLILAFVVTGLIYNLIMLRDSYQFGSGLLRSAEGNHNGMTYPASRLYVLTFILFLLVLFPIMLRYIIRGLKWIVSGFSEIVTPWMPANIPDSFRDYAEVEKGFKDRSLSVYKPFDSFISGIFGGNSMFVTPARRNIVEENGKELKNRVKRLIYSALALGAISLFFHWLPSDSAREFLYDADLEWMLSWINSHLPITTYLPFILLLILQGALALIEFISILTMIPRFQPGTVAQEGIDHYRGFGHPDQIFSRLPDLAQGLRWEEFLNRVDSTWGQRASAAIGDVGEFSGRLIIEQQPQPVDTMGDRPAYLMVFLGWFLLFAGMGLYLFLLLPTQLQQLGFNLFYAPIYVLMMGLVASIAARSGERFVGYGRTILQAAQFRSLGILIQISGTLSRADIRIGKSVADSIESSNVVARSDFSARMWSADLISEASRLDAKRELLGLEQSDENQRWIHFFRDGIENLREEGVKPIGVDLQTKEVDEIIKANISVSALRSSAVEQAQLEVGVTGNDTQLLLESGEGISSNREMPKQGLLNSAIDEYKECPECAEMVRARAKKCRFCGYRFEEE
jgi:hypothetical protein